MAYGLIFDVDGVLADTEALIATATADMFKTLYNADLTVEDFRPYVGTGAVKYTQGPADDKGITIDLDAALKLRYENFVTLVAERGDISMPGAVALVESVAADPDWKLAMATSSPGDKSKETLKATGINTEHFASWITGDMVRRKKPDAEIYVTAALAMRLPPTACVVIEDAVTGITAAKNACMKCIGVASTFSRDELGAADYVVDSLEDVNIPLLLRVLASGDDQITWGARKNATGAPGA